MGLRSMQPQPSPPLPRPREPNSHRATASRAPRADTLGYRPPPARAPAVVERPVLRPRARTRPPVRFGPAARRAVFALAEAIAPPVRPRPDWDPRPVAVDYLQRFAPYLPAPLPRWIGSLLAVFDWAPVLFGPRRRPFSRLPLACRRATLERMLARRGLCRKITHAVRGLVALAIYDQPAVWDAMHYDAPRWIRSRIALRAALHGRPEPW